MHVSMYLCLYCSLYALQKSQFDLPSLFSVHMQLGTRYSIYRYTCAGCSLYAIQGPSPAIIHVDIQSCTVGAVRYVYIYLSVLFTQI